MTPSLVLAGGLLRACVYIKCGTLFLAAHPSQRFCCVAHRHRHNFRIYYKRKKAKSPRWVKKRCKYCKKSFDVSTSGKGKQHRDYCTSRCERNAVQKRYYHRVKAGLVGSEKTRNRILKKRPSPRLLASAK